MAQVLGIIAGGGTFPVSVARNAHAQGYRIVGVGFTSDTSPDFPHYCDTFTWLKLGQLGRLIDFFSANHVTQAIMAGPINKPRALDIRPDWRAARVLLGLRTRGDDMLLRAVTRELEHEGIQVVGPHLFVPDLLAPEGILTLRGPNIREQQDISLAWDLADKLGDSDIGQCIVVRDGIVLAIEAIEGTDAAIRRGGSLGGPGAVVLKRPKVTQDIRLDMPAIGLKTLQVMSEVNATCLAVQSRGCLFFELNQAITYANTNGISITSMLHVA